MTTIALDPLAVRVAHRYMAAVRTVRLAIEYQRRTRGLERAEPDDEQVENEDREVEGLGQVRSRAAGALAARAEMR